MATKPKTEISYAFCLHPENISQNTEIFSFLLIEKKQVGTNYKTYHLEEDIFETYKFHGSVKKVFEEFTPEYIDFNINEIQKFLKKQKVGSNIDSLLSKKINRHLHELFQEVIPIQNENIKLYHKIINPKSGNFLTTKCSFSNANPILSFDIQLKKNKYLLETFVRIDGQTHLLKDFNQNNFLLEKDNIYYLLDYEQYQTLEYLERPTVKNYSTDKANFLKYVVHKLESQFTIEKHNYFDAEVLDIIPKNCLYLSEINSGAFLMLTPQWKYNDIIIDGEFKAIHEVKQNQEIYAVKRNLQVETDFISHIQQTHPNFIKQRNGYFYLSFDEAKKKNWFFKTYHQFLDEDIEIIGMDMLQHFRYTPFPLESKLSNIKVTGNIVEATFKVSFGKENVSLNELQKVVLNEQRSVLLKDNSIGVLTDEWLSEYASILKHSKINKDTISIPKWILVKEDESIKSNSLKFVIPQDWWNKWDNWQQSNQAIYPIPKSIQATLRTYQQKGFEWFCLLSEINAGAYLADDMGLGKTIQTITFIAHQLEINPQDKFLIVCPSSLIYNWKNELEKFLPKASVYTYYGSNRNYSELEKENKSIVITAYSTVRVDVELFKNTLWNTIVLDESHNIKTLYAQTTKAVHQIVAKNKIALSGTPIMNNVFDLYAQLDYLLPTFLGSQEFFRQEYVIPIDKNKNEKKMEALHKLTAPFILRRTKQQVATDLPEKTELTLWCEMEEAQRNAYEQIKARIKKSVFLNIKNEGLAKSKLNVLQGIIKLRQACCSPILLKQADIETKESIKIKILIDEITNNLSKNKVLVFSQFKEMLYLIADELEQQNISYFRFDGYTPITERQKMVSEFQEDNSTIQVFLMSLKTGNAGINLTAADYVFLVDPWWNTAIQDQAIDRTHRIGQTKNVFAYKMICKDTIEEKIIQIQSRKQATSDALIVAEDSFVKNLSQEDIAFLFD